MLAPTAPIKMKWDIVMLFLILYNVIMVPVRICFEVEAPAGSVEFWLETCFDMLFLVDIVLNFNSAYINDEGLLETNRSKIAKTYLKGWFLIDGPSSLPTEPVMELIGLAIPDSGIGSSAPVAVGCAASGGGDTALLMPKLLRFLRMFRFMKLIRLLKAAKIFKVMEEELDVNMSVLKLFKLVFIVVFLGHLIACFVFLANKASQAANVFGMFRLPQFYGCQNTTTEEWVDLFPEDWSPSIGDAYPEYPSLDDCSCENQGIWKWKIVPGEQYVWVLYWTLTTMTTIGYGDVSPLTQGRMLQKSPRPPPPGLRGVAWLAAVGGSGRTQHRACTALEPRAALQPCALPLAVCGLQSAACSPAALQPCSPAPCSPAALRPAPCARARPRPRLSRYIEALITVFVEVAGASIFGYMIGNIASVIADFDKFSSVQKERMEEIKSYLTFKRVPRHLSKAVRKYYGHYYDKRGVDSLKQDWSALPNIIKAELVKFENKDFVDAFSCFLPVDGYDFIELLVQQLRPLCAGLGDCIAGPDKQPPLPSPPSCDFFLICTGEVHKLTPFDPATEVPFKEGDEGEAGDASGGAVELLPPLERRQSSSATRLVEVLKPGKWFGHQELLAAFDEIQAEVEDPKPLNWNHEYKAKRISELLFLVATDFYENVESYSLFRPVLEEQDAQTEDEGEEEAELAGMGGSRAAPAASDGSTVLAASSSTAGGMGGAPPPVSVHEGDMLDNPTGAEQQSSSDRRSDRSDPFFSPPASIAGIAGKLQSGNKAGKSAASAGKAGAGASKPESNASKWAAKVAGKLAEKPGTSQAVLDAQHLRQRIETEVRPARPPPAQSAASRNPRPDPPAHAPWLCALPRQVFGLPLRRADEITDSDILALIRSRAPSALPPRAAAPSAASSAASGPGTPMCRPTPSSPARTPRPSSEVSSTD